MQARHAPPARQTVRSIGAVPVDVAVVLAADASGSITEDRLLLQVEGHARAVESEAVVAAVRAGAQGRIALTFMVWTGADRQYQLVEWTLVDDAAAARGFAAALRRVRAPQPGYTSISGAIDFGTRLLLSGDFVPSRRVIDVCGNGVNNDGRSPALARDEAVAAGITINGLPILDEDRGLDAYYMRDVIGGPGAFTWRATRAASPDAILRKLLREVAGGSAGRAGRMAAAPAPRARG